MRGDKHEPKRNIMTIFDHKKQYNNYTAKVHYKAEHSELEQIQEIWHDTVSRLVWLQSRGKTKKNKSFVGILLRKSKYKFLSSEIRKI